MVAGIERVGANIASIVNLQITSHKSILFLGRIPINAVLAFQYFSVFGKVDVEKIADFTVFAATLSCYCETALGGLAFAIFFNVNTGAVGVNNKIVWVGCLAVFAFFHTCNSKCCFSGFVIVRILINKHFGSVFVNKKEILGCFALAVAYACHSECGLGCLLAIHTVNIYFCSFVVDNKIIISNAAVGFTTLAGYGKFGLGGFAAGGVVNKNLRSVVVNGKEVGVLAGLTRASCHSKLGLCCFCVAIVNINFCSCFVHNQQIAIGFATFASHSKFSLGGFAAGGVVNKNLRSVVVNGKEVGVPAGLTRASRNCKFGFGGFCVAIVNIDFCSCFVHNQQIAIAFATFASHSEFGFSSLTAGGVINVNLCAIAVYGKIVSIGVGFAALAGYGEFGFGSFAAGCYGIIVNINLCAAGVYREILALSAVFTALSGHGKTAFCGLRIVLVNINANTVFINGEHNLAVVILHLKQSLFVASLVCGLNLNVFRVFNLAGLFGVLGHRHRLQLGGANSCEILVAFGVKLGSHINLTTVPRHLREIT